MKRPTDQQLLRFLEAAKTGVTDDIVDFFKTFGFSDMDVQNRFGQTALMLAVQSGSADTVRLFLKAGADVDAQDDFKNTALSKAVVRGNLDIAEILLEAGASSALASQRYWINPDEYRDSISLLKKVVRDFEERIKIREIEAANAAVAAAAAAAAAALKKPLDIQAAAAAPHKGVTEKIAPLPRIILKKKNPAP